MQRDEPSEAGKAPRRRRVGFLNSHPIQYAAPLYAYLNRSDDIEPVGLYLTDFSLRGDVDRQFGRAVAWDIDLLEGYEHRFVQRDWRTARPDRFWSLKGRGLWSAIGEARLDALVVHGHSFLADLVALAAARARGIPVFYKAETNLLLERTRLKAAVRPAALKALFSQVHGFLAIGSRNRQFYRSLGIDESRIFFFPYTVDNARFLRSAELTSDRREQIRSELGLASGVPVVVYASKFTARKRPGDLVRAARLLTGQGHELQLLLIGTGEEEAGLRALAAEEPRLNIVFAGFRNQTELPALLAASDIFVLPSQNEPFGLIVNEAMCAGLPVVASEEIGSVADLVLPGENGFTFAAGDVEGLADALRPLLADPERREAMGRRSREIVARWSYRENFEGLRAALESLE